MHVVVLNSVLPERGRTRRLPVGLLQCAARAHTRVIHRGAAGPSSVR